MVKYYYRFVMEVDSENFGAITNPQIDKISVTELSRNIKRGAEISGSGGVRVWHILMSNLRGSKFAIKAYSKEGKELSSVYDNTSPYSADQKPMKMQSTSQFLKAMFGGIKK
ncbi:hypothetical protein [Ruminiclostridium papyrosolvens]|uniref:Uncharacterized protein n=1 Tax=Ruminiclostridium papyrosolvens C7 TaxID=1330534 RepID=U4QZT6_9FIRM|nr:hypothetical protein [Ruminiclostridium papyrosolvens]EPR10522.1 hypothetical protein L323_13085 [Ruminiclostridium papyrosolvens C7]